MTTRREAGDPALLEELRRSLREARARLLAAVARTEEELATLEAHQPGGPMEDVDKETVTAILSRLDGRERHELDEIHAAQARLETGTFGVCEQCGQPIDLARLRALPVARHCLPCQRRQESAPR
ncbi:MAG: TraR/DksA family transcriptional regulator [Candidatus Rokubacteria bacterium]|nr:TraR/DksA family transcriptional regulator [Candidatus Rokubacteria bacterium]